MKPPENKNEILELFKRGPGILENALAGLSDTELDYVPSNGGWSIRQIVHHLVDGDDLWKMYIKIALGNKLVNSISSVTCHFRKQSGQIGGAMTSAQLMHPYPCSKQLGFIFCNC